jgi:hypothetical protein
MMTNTKMSVFNKYTEPFTRDVKFKKHVIDNVFWDDSKGVNLNRGYDNADAVNVYIPKDKNDMSDYVNPKHYNGSNWTLNNGDLIIKGEVAENEVSGIKELNAYEVFTITMVDDKDFGSPNMQHFEIRGN